MTEMMSEKQQRAKAAEAMAWERSQRPLTAKEKQDAKVSESWDRWASMERYLVAVAPAWVMPAGNACPFAVEGALWVRSHKPHLKKGAAFLSAVQRYRNERLDRMDADMTDFKTGSWTGESWAGEI